MRVSSVLIFYHFYPFVYWHSNTDISCRKKGTVSSFYCYFTVMCYRCGVFGEKVGIFLLFFIYFYFRSFFGLSTDSLWSITIRDWSQYVLRNRLDWVGKIFLSYSLQKLKKSRWHSFFLYQFLGNLGNLWKGINNRQTFEIKRIR